MNNEGKILQITGAVVDVKFAESRTNFRWTGRWDYPGGYDRCTHHSIDAGSRLFEPSQREASIPDGIDHQSKF